MTQTTIAKPRLVPDRQRMAFLPKHFGGRLMLRGESAIYGWLGRLSQDYSGGYWHYYEIPNGFYMAPSGYDTLSAQKTSFCSKENSHGISKQSRPHRQSGS